MTAPIEIVDLGVAPYREVWQRQLDLVDVRKVGDGADTLLLVEHPHVITLGRRREARSNVLAPDGVDVVEIERGGDVTYHGPGQLVVYPIVKLEEGERDLHRFLRNLEQAMIDTLAAFELDAGRVDGATGVWVGGERKIASIGIACRRWVTFHGLALNVSTDLSYFTRINPCGFEASVMTSMARELDAEVDLAAVKDRLAADLARNLDREPVEHHGMVARLAALLVVAGCGTSPGPGPAPVPSAPAEAPPPTPDAGPGAAPLATIASPAVPVCTDPRPRAGLCGCLVDALPMDVDEDSSWDDCELDDDPIAGWTVARLDSTTEDAAILVRELPAGWVAVTELERAVYTGRGSDNSYEIGELRLVDIPGGSVLIVDHAGIDYWMQEDPSGDDDDDDGGDDSGDDDDPPVSEGGTRVDGVTLCPFAGAAAPVRCTSFAVDVAGLDDDLPPLISQSK